jgi:hypothetical protein
MRILKSLGRILGRILGRTESGDERIRIRKVSFVLMRIFDDFSISFLLSSTNTGDIEMILHTLHTSCVRKILTTDPILVREITDSMMNDDKEKISGYMKKRPEFVQAIETFIFNVAEKILERGTPYYSDCWVALTKAADAVHKYTGKDDPYEAGRSMYQWQFPGALERVKEAWYKVPQAIHEDMANLLRMAYGEEGRKYVDSVLKQLSF